MKRTRRQFMKEAAVASAAAALGAQAVEVNAEEAPEPVHSGTCPYFDQPLMCGGPDTFGKYKCDS